jgi:hypothetical protein
MFVDPTQPHFGLNDDIDLYRTAVGVSKLDPRTVVFGRVILTLGELAMHATSEFVDGLEFGVVEHVAKFAQLILVPIFHLLSFFPS